MPTQHEPWDDQSSLLLTRPPHPPSLGTSSSSRSTRLQRSASPLACARRAAARSLRPKLRCCGSSSGTRGLMAASYHANGCTSRGWLSRRVPQSTWCQCPPPPHHKQAHMHALSEPAVCRWWARRRCSLRLTAHFCNRDTRVRSFCSRGGSTSTQSVRRSTGCRRCPRYHNRCNRCSVCRRYR